MSTRSEDLEAFASFKSSLRVSRPKEILFINPQLVPEEVFDPEIARNRGYYAFPPVGLLYLAAVVKKSAPEIKVKILDLNYEILKAAQEKVFSYPMWKDLLEETLLGCEDPFVGVTCMFGTSKSLFLEVTRWIREHHPEIPILAGGVQATYDAMEFLEKNHCDIVFRREAEEQFRIFLENILGLSQEVPSGSVLRVGEKIHDLGTPEGEPSIDWDIRPFYELIDVGDYYEYGSLAAFSRYNGAEKPFATVLSNRGCRARCTFCTVRDFNGFGVRQRPVQEVIDEVKFLVREKGIRQIDWLDDDLLMNPTRTVELFKGLATQVPELEWICNNGLIAAAVNEEIMDWMVKSGLKAFKIGIESGNDEMLHKIKKPTTKPKLRRAREIFGKYPEVFVSANFIIGFPHENFQQMLDTYEFARELKWDWSSFYICQPLKGTEMFSIFKEMGDERTEVESYDKTLNPGRAAARGEFGYQFKPADTTILTGREVFNLAKDLIPSQEQIKEIWFTFNLAANFLENPNFAPGGSPEKIVRWFESIAHAYPNDASMTAALARGYRLMGKREAFESHQAKFTALITKFPYWQRRVREFPELLEFAETTAMEAAS